MKKSMRLLVLLALTLALAVTGCTSQVSRVSVATVLAKVQDVVKADLLENGIKPEEMEEELPGYVQTDLLAGDLALVLADDELLNPELMEEGVALQSMFNISSTEILIIKAKSKTAAKDLEAALQQEKELRLKQWETYLPNQHEKVKNTIIKVQGVHLLYATYEDAAAIEDAFDAALTEK